MRRKIVALVLLLAVALPLRVVVPEAKAAETDLQGTIEEQIRAYADSIDQKDADDEAARIIAMHGVLMGGRTMYADENHALTAVLLNSELSTACLIDGCTMLIHWMQEFNLDEIYGHGGCQWYDPTYLYIFNAYRDTHFEDGYQIQRVSNKMSNASHSEYDASLEWMAGAADYTVYMQKGEITADTVSYDITVTIKDFFDFNTSGASVSADILAILGSAMFREFDWESNVTFQLTVPNDCPHEQFTEEPVDPTCTTPGGTRHTCAACGYSYRDETTPAKGHSLGTYKSNNDATCQKDGTKTATCATCGETDTILDPGSQKPHNWTPAICLYPETCLDCGETRGECIDHDWQDATCTSPKRCSMCGATEGKALGHKWSGSTCEHANTCSVCGAVSGDARPHTWIDATCTSAKRCSFCGTVDGEPLGHDFVGGSCTEGPVCSRCGAKDAAFGHQWTAADCYSARSCEVCGYADGVALGHTWVGPTCTEAKYCSVCLIVEGGPLGHIFADATCEAPETCTGCGLTEGEPLGHDWLDADCENPKNCTCCGVTEGEPLDHSWQDATCEVPKTCDVCGMTEGAALDHADADSDYACDLCGGDLTVPTEPTEVPTTVPTTEGTTTVPTASEPGAVDEESGDAKPWVIGGIALAAVAAMAAALILRKKKK